MPAKMTLAPTIHSYPVKTVNLGTTAQLYTAAEIGKAVKLIAADTYGLCAAGDKIEAVITSNETALTGATRGGLTVGGIVDQGYLEVVCAATLAAGDYVVAAAQPAVGTPLTSIGEGQVPCTPVQKVETPSAPFAMRIVGLGRAGTGAAGTICIAEFTK